MSEFLRILENEVQIVALIFMSTVYIVRILWMMKFKAGKEITQSVGNPQLGATYSLLNVAMPWAMESVRKSVGFYLQFAIFHIAMFAAITATFIIPYWPELFELTPIMRLFQISLAAGCAVGLWRLIRRLTNPVLKLLSTPDDIFSLLLLVAFLASGVFAMPNKYDQSEWPLIIFFVMTTFFLIYVPFSKISHYLYYPFSRYYLGRTMGHRDVFPRKKGGERPQGLD